MSTTTKPNPGRDFERLIASSIKALGPQGLRLKKNDPHFVGAHGRNGQAVGHITGAGGLDYEGRWGPLWVGVELKSTGHATRIDLGLFRDHQIGRIAKAHDDGAIAFALVELRGDSPLYVALDWPTLAPWWHGEHDRRSIPVTMIHRDHHVPRAGRIVDLLAPIRRIAGEIGRRHGV